MGNLTLHLFPSHHSPPPHVWFRFCFDFFVSDSNPTLSLLLFESMQRTAAAGNPGVRDELSDHWPTFVNEGHFDPTYKMIW